VTCGYYGNERHAKRQFNAEKYLKILERESRLEFKTRGLREPNLMIADGAHGLWAATTKASPTAQQQRCWLHKNRNVLDKGPEKQQPRVFEDLRLLVAAPNESEARSRMEALAQSLQREYPKAAACARDDVDRMVTFVRFPQASWKGLRTTNPIESIFASVRLRTDAARRLRTGVSAAFCSSSSINDCRPAGAGSTALRSRP